MHQLRGDKEEAEVMSVRGEESERAVAIARRLGEKGLLVSVRSCCALMRTVEEHVSPPPYGFDLLTDVQCLGQTARTAIDSPSRT